MNPPDITPDLPKNIEPQAPMPRATDLAQDTAATLQLFLDRLIALCLELAQGLEYSELNDPRNRITEQRQILGQLLDGIQTVHEAIVTMKEYVGITEHPMLSEIESEMVEVLRALLQAYESGSVDRFRRILADDLPANLQEWKDKGIPCLTDKGKAG